MKSFDIRLHFDERMRGHGFCGDAGNRIDAAESGKLRIKNTCGVCSRHKVMNGVTRARAIRKQSHVQLPQTLFWVGAVWAVVL